MAFKIVIKPIVFSDTEEAVAYYEKKLPAWVSGFTIVSKVCLVTNNQKLFVTPVGHNTNKSRANLIVVITTTNHY